VLVNSFATKVRPGRLMSITNIMLRIKALSATLAIIAGCSVSQQVSTRKTANSVESVPDFAGTATPGELTSCPNVLPEGMNSPFTPGPGPATRADYQVVGCWRGILGGKSFVVDEYFSRDLGGGIAVQYGGTLVAHLPTGSGAPAIVRFSGDYVCNARRAGAYFEAVNVRTGSRMDDETARKTCPPPTWPPAYVLGLGAQRHSVDWHTTNVH
jgi:hypothetical protein